ncbi:YolD-like family protein [Lederbergia galactosidilytica]|uniref:YolD-like family protein n=1 Tax=Lederbergia galactosidilytica TaxID=217031 RepID=A0A177ZRJ8_9BACI|nr:YolD-like family protein [Lederbergia galactosidilytica]OAK70109.1 hypothetical protein ABB05_13110 [Lederbergia galactosidilytica]
MFKPNKLTEGHNLMWESSRMMLPEHVERILDWRKSLDEEKKPIIDEQQWEEFGQTIQGAMANNQRVKFTVWKDGFFEDIKGWVHSVDPQLKRIRIDLDEFDVDYIPFDVVVDVESISM